jgi:phenylalanyl-tRNA synthetase alpha chain
MSIEIIISNISFTGFNVRYTGNSDISDTILINMEEKKEKGHIHLLNSIMRQGVNVLSELGFVVADGPELESEFYNFDALNVPGDHPARDMQDTFFLQLNPEKLLRTHTSSVQIQELQKHKLPLRVIMPGKVFRNETISARAHCQFHQVDGVYVAENVSFLDMRETLYGFVKEMFGQDVKIRFRSSYFPFTEISAEMDVTCFICGGVGCPVCKQSGWVEILGCGMVDPNVLENCGIDSEKYSGYAFGLGVERLVMLKYGLKDLRVFFENDLRFLQQFKSAY